MHFRYLLFFLAFSVAAWGSKLDLSCAPDQEIVTALQHANAIPVVDPSDFDHNTAPFLELRRHHAENLFVHERYQDAVQRYGIEGHLKAMANEYSQLAIEHPQEVMYQYLYARALVGRSTNSAIAMLDEILAGNPAYMPAHQALGEIYSSQRFHDREKRKTERQKFLSACPQGVFQEHPLPLPAQGELVNRAAQLLAENRDLESLVDMANRGLQHDEWRLQRIRLFDWYSYGEKIKAQQELESEYWRVWDLQVRCYRKLGQSDKANELLAEMEQRLRHRRANAPDKDAFTILAGLYTDVLQKEQASRKLEELQQLQVETDRSHKIENKSSLP